MFIGHFGVGFAAKAVASQVSLGTAFLAAQFIDLLWPTLLLLGVERVRIEPGITTVTPLNFEHYPVSHSLLAVVGWAVLLGAVYFWRHNSARGAVIVGWAVCGLVAFLGVIYLGNLFGEPPPSAAAIAWIGQAQWLLVAWGYWVDHNRSAVGTGSPPRVPVNA